MAKAKTDLVPFRQNTDQTHRVWQNIEDARCARGMSLDAIVSVIENTYGYRLTVREYKAARNGMTKNVNLDLVLFAARALEMDGSEILFGVI